MEVQYKAFDKDLKSTHGGSFEWEVGKWYTQQGAIKCHKNGFHCAENPLDCLRVYGCNPENRYFMVEIDGEIDDEGNEIAAEKMRLIEEISVEDMLVAAVRYAAKHIPERTENWVTAYKHEVKIAIGDDPAVCVKGVPAFIGMIKLEGDRPVRARAFRFDEPGTYRLEES